MPTEYLLDARELEAPLPLERAIKIARELKSGEYFMMLHRMKPCKLGAVLEKMGIAHIYFEDKAIHYMFGYFQDDIQTKKFLKKRLEDEYGRTIVI